MSFFVYLYQRREKRYNYVYGFLLDGEYVMEKSSVKYKTRPIESFQKAREMREDMFKEAWKAREEGKKIALAISNRSHALIMGIGNIYPIELSSYVLQTSTKKDLSVKCLEAVESNGFYPGDYCVSIRLYIGTMFMGKGFFGEFMKPDFVLCVQYCEPIGKAAQLIGEHLKIPHFILDYPLIVPETTRAYHIKYFVNQMQDAIEWMEKVTDREYDDEKLIEAIKNEERCTILWAKICEMQKNIPAPLSQRQLFGLASPVNQHRYLKESVQYAEMLHDEVKDRVKEGIAALPTERCRLMHEGLQVLYSPDIMRCVEKYGAVFIGSHFDLGLGSLFTTKEDYSWEVMKSREERGLPIRTREDALETIAEYYFNNPTFTGYSIANKPEEAVRLVKDWHVDGVVFHNDRGCQGLSSALPEARLLLQEGGIPSMVYESSHSDPRSHSESNVISAVEAFMESLGLKELKD